MYYPVSICAQLNILECEKTHIKISDSFSKIFSKKHLFFSMCYGLTNSNAHYVRIKIHFQN